MTLFILLIYFLNLEKKWFFMLLSVLDSNYLTFQCPFFDWWLPICYRADHAGKTIFFTPRAANPRDWCWDQGDYCIFIDEMLTSIDIACLFSPRILVKIIMRQLHSTCLFQSFRREPWELCPIISSKPFLNFIVRSSLFWFIIYLLQQLRLTALLLSLCIDRKRSLTQI